jgi:2-C-methyl-D-erythritol 4-phosphate cytidylyltransferase
MGRTAALLLAAGWGSRLGREPKAFVELGGVPLFVHSLRAIRDCPGLDEVVVMVPEGFEEAALRWAGPAGLEDRLRAWVGGSTRQESVRLGLAALGAGWEVVVCHDAARPFATSALFGRVLEGLLAAKGDDGVAGVVPVVPSPDTVKLVRGGRVVETIPRDQVGLAQTPQAFRAQPLAEAHRLALRTGIEATDDAMLLEAAGYGVGTVEGESDNFKVTTPADLRRAEAVLAARTGEEVQR